MIKIFQNSVLLGVVTIGCSGGLFANSISVNFHVGDDQQMDRHQISAGEFAGSEAYGIISSKWNNIDIGAGGLHRKPEQIFPPTKLIDQAGKRTGVVLSAPEDSTYFVGYAASAETVGAELGLPGNQDNLYNSYLSLGTDDSAVLKISNLGRNFTAGGYLAVIYSDTDEGKKKKGSAGPRQSLFKLTPSNGAMIQKFTEDDPDIPNHDSTFDGSFVLSDGIESGLDYSNVVVFDGLTADSFTLELTSPDSKRGGISGFQIISNAALAAGKGKKVDIPEPATTVALTGLIVFLAATLRRRPRVA
ncbi:MULTISPECIES: hypothetical protein [unclassified Lentimonas]|uniref:hypothetical protein n=1 Tax=unclassified Lentimonas TaxID=2630993 RepID=UPI001329EC14|nr:MULTISPECIES: hypothetical protein [unclassified Lentimonas]CAA6691872.1 Unannotated [Lentimonas sp. CC10]CAA6692086.1 Unannotated [Lentimonas sp. CC19]CAA7070661.1 Unannotated [Lentimonas sp. CC11]